MKLEISSIRKFGSLELISFSGNSFSIKPGQFLIVYHPEKDDHLTPIYFCLQLEDFFFSRPLNNNWEIGDQLIAKGPIGTGFSSNSDIQNLICISLGKPTGGLNPILEISVKNEKNVAYMVEEMNLILPNSVEIVLSETLDETLLWADRVFIEGERDQLEKNVDLLRKILDSKIPTEILVYCPILCSGGSQCLICSVKTKKGWVKTCQDGAVFNLDEMVF